MTKRAILAGLVLWAGLVVGVAELPGWRASGQPGSTRTLTAEAPAGGVKIIDMAATDGSVTITGSTDDRIRISVDVSAPERTPRWFERKPGDPARADLLAERRGDVYVARVRAAGSAPLVERWTLHVPRRLRVGVVANDSAIDVVDIAGGVLVKANAGLYGRPGSIRVSVPGGMLDLSLNVGTIDATTTSSSRGPVDVQSSVGDARLSIGGRQIQSPRRPGPGHRLRLDDPGPDPITLRVSVGDASLTIK